MRIPARWQVDPDRRRRSHVASLGRGDGPSARPGHGARAARPSGRDLERRPDVRDGHARRSTATLGRRHSKPIGPRLATMRWPSAPPVFSPDGRWIALLNEAAEFRRFPPPDDDDLDLLSAPSKLRTGLELDEWAGSDPSTHQPIKKPKRPPPRRILARPRRHPVRGPRRSRGIALASRLPGQAPPEGLVRPGPPRTRACEVGTP